MHHPNEEVTVALVGKYIDLPDAYLSVVEALRAGGFAHEATVNIEWVPSDECETPEGAARRLGDVDAICVPGGFGIRGIEGKLGALTYARTHKIPTLGLCLGLQCMVIEYARQQAGLEKAASTEFDPDCPEPVIATMAEQHAFVEGAGDLGGTMRLGLYPADLKEGSVVRATYGAARVEERHRHRYEVNNSYREQLEAAGLVFSGTSPDNNLVEFVELPADVHPYYVATQAHPELRSRPTRPHPLFAGLVGAAIQRQRELLIPIDESALRRRWIKDDDGSSRPRRGGARPGRPRGRVTPTRTPGPSARDRRRAARLAGPRLTRPPPRRLGGGAARGHRPAPGPPRGDLRSARGRAPGCRRRARRRRRGAGLLLRQYRHAGEGLLIELPAGICDSHGEDPQVTAARELREEVELRAQSWRRLLTLYPTAGITTELHQIYLARGLVALRPR